MAKNEPMNKSKIAREDSHLTRPPRLKGAVHHAAVKPKKKPKKNR